MYNYYNVQGQCLGIHDFMLVINSVRLPKFLIARGIISHIFGARYLNDFKPYFTMFTGPCLKSVWECRLHQMS